MKGAENILNQVNALKDVLSQVEKITTPMSENLNELINDAPEKDREKIAQFVKESSGLVEDSNMGFAEKLIKLNELKAKYGNSSSNK